MPGPYDKFQEAFETFQESLKKEIHEELETFKQEILIQVSNVPQKPVDLANNQPAKKTEDDNIVSLLNKVWDKLTYVSPRRINCESCGSRVFFTYRYCKRCGLKNPEYDPTGLSEFFLCGRCKAINSIINDFCTNCGTSFSPPPPPDNEVSLNDHHPELSDDEETEPFNF